MLKYIALIIVLFILLFIVFTKAIAENYTNPTIQPTPYVKLYESFNGKDMVFEFQPILEDPSALYFRDIVKVNVKSMDLNLPLKGDDLDDIRTIEIWSLYDGSNIASSESDFYNPFTEPDFARKANSAKYKLIVKMKAGQRIKLNVSEPIKKVFIYARF